MRRSAFLEKCFTSGGGSSPISGVASARGAAAARRTLRPGACSGRTARTRCSGEPHSSAPARLPTAACAAAAARGATPRDARAEAAASGASAPGTPTPRAARARSAIRRQPGVSQPARRGTGGRVCVAAAASSSGFPAAPRRV
jgi:hypothetical protein